MSFEYLRPLFLISLIINLHSLICNNGSVYQWVHQVPKNLTTGFHESGQAGSSTPRAKAENVPGGGRTHSRSGTQRRRHKSWGFDLWVWKIPRLLEMAGNGNPLALRVPWTEEPGGLHSTGLQKVRHDWATKRTPFWSMWIPRTVLTDSSHWALPASSHFFKLLWIPASSSTFPDALGYSRGGFPPLYACVSPTFRTWVLWLSPAKVTAF